MNDNQLIDLLEKARSDNDPAHDIAKAMPDLTLLDAYRLQHGYKRRLAGQGDPHVGYRVSMTTRAGLIESVNLGILPPEALDRPLNPVFTALSQSNLGTDACFVEAHPDYYMYAEAEVAMVIAKPLAGPGVTPERARMAVAGFYAGFDMAQIPKNSPFGFQHKVASACSPIDTRIILGPKMTEPTIDLRLEGVLVSIDGEARASATAWECLGDPINAVAFLANKLGEIGESLQPGQIVITGCLPIPQQIKPGERLACAEFTRLGRVTARIAA
ncbi:2-keto-4-pentenoate hydratase [Croceicoccus bisphenolivorans]|uniref:2-keto-4-pentenoate hydratase n=1 Tax=Croceicoccus bisphenolivorans TaxID=1783232 RepID=UPI00082FFBC5|nr:fumarylacetoacetate hydrolase family protein [Croceicoccus bisphenolivorans]